MNGEVLELIHLPTYLPKRISITILKPLFLPVSSIFSSDRTTQAFSLYGGLSFKTF